MTFSLQSWFISWFLLLVSLSAPLSVSPLFLFCVKLMMYKMFSYSNICLNTFFLKWHLSNRTKPTNILEIFTWITATLKQADVVDFVFSKAKKRKYLCVSWVDTKPYVLFTSLSFHPVNTYLTYHCICEYIILFAFHAQFTWYPGTWLHGHMWQKKQHPESKWSVLTLDGNEK